MTSPNSAEELSCLCDLSLPTANADVSKASESSEKLPASLRAPFLKLYCAVCAPLSKNVANEPSETEAGKLYAMIQETQRFNAFASTGMTVVQTALNALASANDGPGQSTTQDDLWDTPEALLSLNLAAGFARRLAVLSHQLAKQFDDAAEAYTKDTSGVITALHSCATENRNALSVLGAQFKGYIDCAAELDEWEVLESATTRNRVGFKETADIISEGQVGEETLKGCGIGRKKQRNPTGYEKFNFKDLRMKPSDCNLDSWGDGANRVLKNSADHGSTQTSLCGGIGLPGDALTAPRSAFVKGDDTGNDQFDSSSSLYPERNGSVVFSFERERQVIQDEEADPQWDEQQRHQERFSRIRNRVPTGHPQVIKRPSDDLATLGIEEEEELLGIALDPRTVENTELNKFVPCSWLNASPPKHRNVCDKLTVAGKTQQRTVTMSDAA